MQFVTGVRDETKPHSTTPTIPPITQPAVTGPGVSTFNGRVGNVKLTKGDVAATGYVSGDANIPTYTDNDDGTFTIGEE